MEFEIKNKYFIIAIVVLLLLSFGAGWGLNDTCAKREASKLAEYYSDIENQLANARRLSSDVTNGLRWIARANSEITRRGQAIDSGLGELADSYSGYITTVGDIRESIGEDSERLSDLYAEIRSFAE